MRNTRKYVILAVVAALCLCVAMPVMAQPKGGAMMPMDVYTPIAQGYDFVREGKYEAAKNEFDKAMKADPNNSFAFNNNGGFAGAGRQTERRSGASESCLQTCR